MAVQAQKNSSRQSFTDCMDVGDGWQLAPPPPTFKSMFCPLPLTFYHVIIFCIMSHNLDHADTIHECLKELARFEYIQSYQNIH